MHTFMMLSSAKMTCCLVMLIYGLVIQMCRMYRLSTDRIVEEWVAFCSTKKLDIKRVTIDMLDQLDREVMSVYYCMCNFIMLMLTVTVDLPRWVNDLTNFNLFIAADLSPLMRFGRIRLGDCVHGCVAIY